MAKREQAEEQAEKRGDGKLNLVLTKSDEQVSLRRARRARNQENQENLESQIKVKRTRPPKSQLSLDQAGHQHRIVASCQQKN